MDYKNPTPVAVCVARVRRLDSSLGLLGIVRKLTPVGGLAFPGGFVDELESARMAAAREFREETRFVTQPSQWELLEDAVSPSNRLLLFCELRLEVPEQQLQRFTETSEVSGLFCIGHDSQELCFPLHQDFAKVYLANAGLERYALQQLPLDESDKL